MLLERGRQRGRERNIDVRKKHQLLPPIPVCVRLGTRDQELTFSLGMCPDQESNP